MRHTGSVPGPEQGIAPRVQYSNPSPPVQVVGVAEIAALKEEKNKER